MSGILNRFLMKNYSLRQLDQIIHLYSIGKQTEEICRSVFGTIYVLRFRLLTEDHETTKFQVLKEKAYMGCRSYGTTSRVVIREFQIRFWVITEVGGDPIDKSMGVLRC
jgi:hypothetical protein